MGRTRPKKSKILFEIRVFSTNKDRTEFIGPKIIFSNLRDERRFFPPKQTIEPLLPQAKNHPENQGTNTNKQSKDYSFVILSGAKNLFFSAAEILHSAALRSE